MTVDTLQAITRTPFRRVGSGRPASFGTPSAAAALAPSVAPLDLLTVSAVKLVDRQQVEQQWLVATELKPRQRQQWRGSYRPRVASGQRTSGRAAAGERECMEGNCGREGVETGLAGMEGLWKKEVVPKIGKAATDYGDFIHVGYVAFRRDSGDGKEEEGARSAERDPLLPRIDHFDTSQRSPLRERSEEERLVETKSQLIGKRTTRGRGQRHCRDSSAPRDGGKLRGSEACDSTRQGRDISSCSQASVGSDVTPLLQSSSGDVLQICSAGDSPVTSDSCELRHSHDLRPPVEEVVTGVVGRRTSPTGATARVVSHLRARRSAGLAKTAGAGVASVRASRRDFDPEESARKAAARLLAYRKSQAAARAEAEKAEIAKRRAVAEARLQANIESERRRLNVYALNAVLTKHERANILIVLEQMQTAQQAGNDDDTAAELLAAVATNSV